MTCKATETNQAENADTGIQSKLNDALGYIPTNRPKVVVFCGSSRYVDIMAVCAWLVEREEKTISMGLHLLPQWYLSPAGHLPSDHLAEHEGVADEMDRLHLCKIDLCDEIFVIDFDGYVGTSTAREIAYAESLGKPIRWYRSDYIGGYVDLMIKRVKELIEQP